MSERASEGCGAQAREYSVGEVARIVGGRAEGDATVRVRGIAGLGQAGAGELSFVADGRHQRTAARSKASALVVCETYVAASGSKAALIRVPDVQSAIERAGEIFAPPEPVRPSGVDGTAVIARGAELGAGVAVGAGTVIEEGARIGEGTVLHAQVFIGRDAAVGSRSEIHAGVRIGRGCRVGDRVILHSGVVLGADGFGYTFTGEVHRKVPQRGVVVIEDDVEIGANTTVDRARFGATRIGQGTKIDNLVMIAHNVQVGRHCIITAQCGIAGSTTLGDYVVVGAQTGIVDHVEIGDRVTIGGGAVVTKSIPAGETWLGLPAEPRERAMRQMVAIRRLPELLRSVKALRATVDRLCEATGVEKTATND